MELYRHTQPGTVIRVSMLIGILVSGGFLLTSLGSPMPVPLITGIVFGTLLISLVLFHSLTVIVTEDQIRIAFGPGLIRRSWALEAVENWKTVRNPWYYGFGIHLVRGGWLYNVSGLQAVELTLRDGRICRIGTDAPEELKQALARGKHTA
jgi:hypothetical protein